MISQRQFSLLHAWTIQIRVSDVHSDVDPGEGVRNMADATPPKVQSIPNFPPSLP